MKKVIVFGNQKIAIDCLEILHGRSDINVLRVIGCGTSTDKLYGYPSLFEYCQKKNISFVDSNNVNNSLLDSIKKLKPDLCFSFYYRKILKKSYIELAPGGFINIHPSLLPTYRGPVPSMWALLNGETITGTTIHYIDECIDSGDIIAQREIPIDVSISGFELHGKLMYEGAKLFKETLPSILLNKINRIKQNHSNASYYGPFKHSIRYIDWYAPTISICNKIRVFKKPYAGAVGKINEKEVIIWSAEKPICSKKKINGPGKIVKVNQDNTFIVSSVDGYLLVKEFEFQEKNLDSKNYIAVNNIFSF